MVSDFRMFDCNNCSRTIFEYTRKYLCRYIQVMMYHISTLCYTTQASRVQPLPPGASGAVADGGPTTDWWAVPGETAQALSNIDTFSRLRTFAVRGR